MKMKTDPKMISTYVAALMYDHLTSRTVFEPIMTSSCLFGWTPCDLTRTLRRKLWEMSAASPLERQLVEGPLVEGICVSEGCEIRLADWADGTGSDSTGNSIREFSRGRFSSRRMLC